MRKLHERRWRDKLGLFVCEGEDLVAAATAEPVELLVAGENVEAALLAEVSTAAHPPRVIGVYRRDDLPAPEPRPVRARALAGRRSRERRDADPHGRRVRRRASRSRTAAPTRPARRRCAPRPARSGACRCCRSVTLQPQAGRARGARRRCRSARPTCAGEVVFLLGAEREGLPAEVERELEVTIPIADRVAQRRRRRRDRAPRVAAAKRTRSARSLTARPGATRAAGRRRCGLGRSLVQSRLRQTQIESSWPAHGVSSNQP